MWEQTSHSELRIGRQHTQLTAQLGRNVGIAAQQWHAYAQAAEWAGSSSERLADVIKDLNVKIADAAKTGGGPMADFFKQIGQSAQSWAALSPDEQLRRFTAELQKMSASDARFWLDELNDAQREVVDLINVLVDGKFVQDLKDPALIWRGSSNQVVHRLR